MNNAAGTHPGHSPDKRHRAPELYDVSRGQIEHEDQLIGLRVGWFNAAEAFLVAAYGIVITVPAKPALTQAKPIDIRLFEVVPSVGIVMAVLVGLGIGVAMHRMRILHTGYREHARTDPKNTRGPFGEKTLEGLSTWALSAPPAGLEPATHGLGNRRSIL
jgi:hypothetical protein